MIDLSERPVVDQDRREVHRAWGKAARANWRLMVAITVVAALLGAGISYLPVPLPVRAFDVGFLTALLLFVLASIVWVSSETGRQLRRDRLGHREVRQDRAA